MKKILMFLLISGQLACQTRTVTTSGVPINFVPRMSQTSVITSGLIYDNGTSVGVGQLSPSVLLHVGPGASTGLGELLCVSKNQNNNTWISVLNQQFGSASTAGIFMISDVCNTILGPISTGYLTSGMAQAGTSILQSYAGHLNIGTYTSHKINFWTNNTQAGTILPSGYWGIGQNTPLALLHVGPGGILANEIATFSKSQAAATLVTINNPSSASGGLAQLALASDVAQLIFSATSSGSPATVGMTSLGAPMTVGTYDSHYLEFVTNSQINAFISSAGRFGIGNDNGNPNYLLDVKGGDIAVQNSGYTIRMNTASASNQCAGKSTMSSGTKTVTTSCVKATSLIFVTDASAPNGICVGTVSDATSFVVLGTGSDNFFWWIVNAY
jgi:hypothetical protein